MLVVDLGDACSECTRVDDLSHRFLGGPSSLVRERIA
jgi:hypothetical protein